MEKSADSSEMDEEKTDVREMYEVTLEGLRRPEKPLKLKRREELARERGEQENVEQEEEEEEENEEEGEDESDNEDDEDEKEKAAGTPLMLISLDTGIQRTYPAVVSYRFSKNGETIAFATSVGVDEENEAGVDENGEKSVEDEDEGPADGVHVIQLDSLELMTIADGTGEYKNIAFNDDGSQVAFITNKDDYETKTPTWAVYHWTSRAKEAQKIATEGDKGIRNGWWIAPDSNQRYSEDGHRLYFDTAPVPDDVVEERNAEEEGREVKKDEQDEEAKLDVWHWQDPQLQPQQLLQAEIERNRDYRAAYVLKPKRIVQLATRQIPDVSVDYRSSSEIAVANTNMQYRKMLSWTFQVSRTPTSFT